MSFTIDGKEKINQFKSNLHATDLPYNDFKKLFPSALQFSFTDLKIPGKKRNVTIEIVVEASKKIVQISSSIPIRNADHLLSKMDIKTDVQWVGKDQIRVDTTKYNMSH